ncbi:MULTISPECIES: flagellar filament capping protein FliD [Janthinobacterium]|uniref:Flagellar hook-associated protein 2 n=1 Tax=Janthinobacterium kumbetense TaxID=2950280 RepID=A0ABT0WMR9_9BURK|nr:MULTISPECIES: flagellar filament capping protein FliD [Janthinobacterium]MCM2565362.1 flagellar filament capping protein FliD [Janthinobacterium kumbetense]MDN2676877.1 flagellar filament capping protein FliD [Janthinobacterium sp. SUN033]MDO8064399.1 flagellar filament capping protein FliD [Janthinobacterium sp. SUN206]MDO8070736.1 flagellar filament capping protein FliD [Janthinobacterium sp. SUN176]MED5612224.1 flagellar filament capping protein FliD [Janthinobacterium sp. P210005]
MASVITAPQYDPIPTAEKLATKAIAAQKAALQAQNTLASNTSTALGNLKSAISAFQSAMSSMTSSKSVLSQSATFPAAGYGTATAGINATPGTYSFFVEKLATASQMSYGGLSNVNTADGTGTLKVKIGDGVGDNTLNIDLAAADKDGNGTLTPQEIAAAINGNSKNNSRVTASIVTINNQAQLVLTSNATGIANAATLDASAVDNIALKGALIAPANIKEVVKADDAIVWLGGKPGGTAITQASNTFTNVQDVKITFTRAMSAAEAPVTLTVATDNSGTAANVQAFVDAYNKLKTLMDGLASPGNPEKNIAAGIFAHDSGLNALRSSMGDALRLNINGVSLVSYGITAQRDGTISLNAAKLTAKLADNPTGLDKLFGNNSLSAPAGVLGSLDKVLGQWSNVTKGQITQRQAATDKLQKSLVKSGERLTAQYDTAYKRFLDQFTRLQVLQEQMSKTSDMFDAMFSNNKS